MSGARALQDGFTFLELLVVTIVVSVAGTVFLERLRTYQEWAEKAAMESTLRLIKTGLQIRLAELIITNRQGEAPELEIADPTQWLEPKPANYAGPYREPPEPGNWYFDTRRKQLVYVVNTGNRLESRSSGDVRELRFQTRLLKDRLNIGGAAVDSVTGVTLAPVSAFHWSLVDPTAILT